MSQSDMPGNEISKIYDSQPWKNIIAAYAKVSRSYHWPIKTKVQWWSKIKFFAIQRNRWQYFRENIAIQWNRPLKTSAGAIGFFRRRVSSRRNGHQFWTKVATGHFVETRRWGMLGPDFAAPLFWDHLWDSFRSLLEPFSVNTVREKSRIVAYLFLLLVISHINNK